MLAKLTSCVSTLQSWSFWLIILLVILLFIWIIFGRRKYTFVGLAPLHQEPAPPNTRITPHLLSIDPSSPQQRPTPIITPPVSSPIQRIQSPIGTLSPKASLHRPRQSSPIDARTPISVIQQSPDQVVDNTPAIPEELKRNHPAPLQVEEEEVDEKEEKEGKEGDDIDPELGIPRRYVVPREQIGYKKREPFRSRGEVELCRVLEKIYGVPFQRNYRGSEIINPETNSPLELDCYNADLKIAGEYSGEQHYKFPHHFHRSFNDFIQQVRRDQFKIDMCDRLGIYLITVPYNVPLETIEDYVRYYMPEAVMERMRRGETT